MGCKFSSGVSSPTQADARPAAQPEVIVVADSVNGQPVEAAAVQQPLLMATPGEQVTFLGKRQCLLKRDAPDHRDLIFRVGLHSKVKCTHLPLSVDLRSKESFPVYEQGELGSCTANAISAAFHYEQLRQGLPDFAPSRLFIYYCERKIESNIKVDAGASLRDGMTVITKTGVCEERMWPYEVKDFATEPSAECYAKANLNTCKQYARVNQDLASLKGCLAAGHPFVFGFVVTSEFMQQKGGIMSYPPIGHVEGGHAVQACGYKDEAEVFIVRNSWGKAWGDGGHFYMPYKFITDPELAFDFWAIKCVDHMEFPVDPDPDDYETSSCWC